MKKLIINESEMNKLMINASELFTEMAKVGSISNKVGQDGNYFIYVYDNERNIPHFHIKERTGTFDCCVRLDNADYFSHSNHTDKLTKSLKKSLIHFLKEPNKKNKKLTNYEACVFGWNLMNENHEITDTNMPDYENLDTIG